MEHLLVLASVPGLTDRRYSHEQPICDPRMGPAKNGRTDDACVLYMNLISTILTA